MEPSCEEPKRAFRFILKDLKHGLPSWLFKGAWSNSYIGDHGERRKRYTIRGILCDEVIKKYNETHEFQDGNTAWEWDLSFLNEDGSASSTVRIALKNWVVDLFQEISYNSEELIEFVIEGDAV